MNPNEKILHQLMILIEQIQNTSNQSMQLPGIAGEFFRGELHVMAIVGHDSGIYSSQIARCLNVSRAVTHKTVNRLVARDLLVKSRAKDNQKQWSLSLSEAGQRVFLKHQETYQSSQSALGKVLDDLSDEARLGVDRFLGAAIALITPEAKP